MAQRTSDITATRARHDTGDAQTGGPRGVRGVLRVALGAVSCALLLSACASPQPQPVVMQVEGTQKSSNLSDMPMHDGYAQSKSVRTTAGLVDIANVPSSKDVQIFALDGPVSDTFGEVRHRRSVFENTTSGGYTVLEPDVMVFPLEDAPMPDYLAPLAAAASASGTMTGPGGIGSVTPDMSNFETVVVGSQIPTTKPDPMAVPHPVTGLIPPAGFDRAATGLPPINEGPQLSLPAPTAYKAAPESPFDPDGAFKPNLSESQRHTLQLPPSYADHGVPAPIPGGMTTTPVMAGPSMPAQAMATPVTGQMPQAVPAYNPLASRAGTTSLGSDFKSAEPASLYRGATAPVPASPAPAASAVPYDQIPPAPNAGAVSGVPTQLGAPAPQATAQVTPQAAGAAAVDSGAQSGTATSSPRRGMLTGY